MIPTRYAAQAGPQERARPFVFLLTLPREPAARRLALELARSAHRLAFLSAGSGEVSPPVEEGHDLQLAVDRAGGIALIAPRPLASPGPGLAWVFEAFAHLDAALAWRADEAQALVAALATLSARRRRGVSLFLLSDQADAPAGQEFRVLRIDREAGPKGPEEVEAAALAGRLVAALAGAGPRLSGAAAPPLR